MQFFMDSNDQNIWHCIKCEEKLRRTNKFSGFELKSIHSIGLYENLLKTYDSMKCYCGESDLVTIEKVDSCEACSFTKLRHHEEIYFKGKIFKSQINF